MWILLHFWLLNFHALMIRYFYCRTVSLKGKLRESKNRNSRKIIARLSGQKANERIIRRTVKRSIIYRTTPIIHYHPTQLKQQTRSSKNWQISVRQTRFHAQIASFLTCFVFVVVISADNNRKQFSYFQVSVSLPQLRVRKFFMRQFGNDPKWKSFHCLERNTFLVNYDICLCQQWFNCYLRRVETEKLYEGNRYQPSFQS